MIVLRRSGGMCRVVSHGSLFLLLCIFNLPVHAQISFPVSFASNAAGLTPNERSQLTSHYQAAGQQWADSLGVVGPRSIEIIIGVENIATANGSSVTSTFFGVFGNRNTFEQGAAHELRTGVDPNGSNPDVAINIGLNYLRNELWFDPNPNSRSATVPADKTDAMSFALHELGHVLGYNGWANGLGVPPADFWSTFDRWMQGSLPTTFHGPAVLASWGSAPELTTNNISHWGNFSLDLQAETVQSDEAVEWRDGVPVPRNSCAGLISIDPPASSAESPLTDPLAGELMNGIVFIRGTRYYISDLDLAAITDAGLPVDPDLIFRNGLEF